MEDLNELSNEELQYRLAQFGVPNIPVTVTTRKTLIKRLRNLIEGEKSKLRRDTEYATRYSSDEDISSTVNDTKAKTTKGRSRSTISTSNRLANQSLNMPPPTTQKPSTSLWNEKSQVNVTEFFSLSFSLCVCVCVCVFNRIRKIIQRFCIFTDYEKVTINLHISTDSTRYGRRIRSKRWIVNIVFKSIQK